MFYRYLDYIENALFIHAVNIGIFIHELYKSVRVVHALHRI